MSIGPLHVPAWANSPALRDIVEARLIQQELGFTREHDLALHPARLPELVARHVAEALETLHGTPSLFPADPREALVNAAAVAWAAIDRIDATRVADLPKGGDA